MLSKDYTFVNQKQLYKQNHSYLYLNYKVPYTCMFPIPQRGIHDLSNAKFLKFQKLISNKTMITTFYNCTKSSNQVIINKKLNKISRTIFNRIQRIDGTT